MAARSVKVVSAIAVAVIMLANSAPATGQGLFRAPQRGAAEVVASDIAPVAAASGGALRITKGSGTLPNEHGQVWREYDISGYTARVKDNDRPQQAVIDWILRETGTDVWFGEPLGVLSASTTALRVYHTPEMHETVREVVERMVSADEAPCVLGLRLVTVSSPNWRSRAVTMLKPIEVKSSGVEAWLLSRENAAMLYEELKARADFREHGPPQIEIVAGQSQTLARMQPLRYSRGVNPRGDGLGYELVPGQIEEGYSLSISPLPALDGKSVDVAVKCQVDQVEKLVPVILDVPVVGQGPRVQIQVPQLASWRLAERFRWPADQVLLLSCGVVANPAAGAGAGLAAMNPFGASKSRADALLLIEYRGAAATSVATLPQGATR